MAMNETVLITGASGFLGKRLVQYLQRTTDAYVITTSRKQESFLNHLVRDLNDVTAELTQNVDTVIHSAWEGNEDHTTETMCQWNLDNSVRLLKVAIASGVKRFVFLSSVAVHGDHTNDGKAMTEESPINPQSLYAKSKYAVEEALRKMCAPSDINLLIVRLPMIYHVDIKNGFGRYIAMIQDNRPLPFDKISNQRTMLALCNFETGLGAILHHPTIQNETLILADNFSQSTTDMMNGIAISAELPLKLFYVPKRLMKISLQIKGRKDEFNALWNDHQVSSGYAQKRLVWKPIDNFVANLSN